MMDEELSLLKKSLLSLVVSSATTMTVSRLMKDYRSIVGGTMPVGKYGYREPIQFLRERCTDIFVVEGPSRDPILTPKITKNLAHIDQMVQRQKVQSSAKHIGKRRSVFQPSQPVESKPITRSGPPNRYNTNNNYDKKPPALRNTNIVTKIEAKPEINQDIKPKINQDIKKEKDNNYKHTDNENNSYLSNDNKCNRNLRNNEKENSNVVEQCRSSSALSQFYKKRLPQYNSDMDFPSCDAEKNSKGSAESGRQSSTSSSSKQALLDELKADISALINHSENGVWCTDLIKLYKERYGRELRFNCFGHTSLISLVYSMEDRVCISRPQPDGDWLLQEPGRSRPRGPGAGPGPGPRPRRAPRPVPPRARSPEPDDAADALPGVDFEADVFPEDCLHYLEGIPAPALEELQPGTQLEVLIGEVYSPSHFWLLRVGAEHNLAMEQLMDEMTEYYRGEGSGRVLSRGAIRVGQYCASLYDNDWHRSLIVAVIDSDTVKVRHVDYGTVDSVSVAALKPLRREWSRLPAQGVRARLAGCRPAAAGWRWPRAACAWLLARVQDRRLYANLLHVDWEEDIVETFLIDTSGSEDVCLTRELIRVGHADRRADSALQSEDCYLYPRFAVLERGATPNYGDICRMLADGIALEYVDEYRRHVPGPWTWRPAAAEPPAPPAPPALRNCVPLLRAPQPPPPCTASPSPPPTLHPGPRASTFVSTPTFVPTSTFVSTPTFVPTSTFVSTPTFVPSSTFVSSPAFVPSSAFVPTPAFAPSSAFVPSPGFVPGPQCPMDPRACFAPRAACEGAGPGDGAGLEVRVSSAEWAVLAHLRGADADAAHWYALTAAWRALLPPPPGL